MKLSSRSQKYWKEHPYQFLYRHPGSPIKELMRFKEAREGQTKPREIGNIANMIKILNIIPISKCSPLIFLFHLIGKKIFTRTVVNQGK